MINLDLPEIFILLAFSLLIARIYITEIFFRVDYTHAELLLILSNHSEFSFLLSRITSCARAQPTFIFKTSKRGGQVVVLWFFFFINLESKS